jgi:hypothetical protein
VDASLPLPSSSNSTAIRTATPFVTCCRTTNAGQLGGIDGHLDASVHGAGMHDERVGLQAGGPRRGEAVQGGVLAKRRDQCVAHALSLHPQQVHHVEVGDQRVEVVADLDRPGVHLGRQQRGRRDERDVGAERRERLHVAARDPAVLDVADDRDVQPVEAGGAAEVGADRVAVEQRLRGVLVPPVAGVDDRGGRPLRDLLGRTARRVADHERIDAHRGDRLDRVAQALTLVDAARGDREVHHVGAEAPGRRVEAGAGAGRVLEEQVDDRLAAQCRHLRHRTLVHLDHVVGEVEQVADRVGVEVADVEQVLHTSSTPSGVTTTFSCREVGRFLPT